MRTFARQMSFVGMLLFLMIWTTSCEGPASPPTKNLPTRSVATASNIQRITQQVLMNMHLYAWNPHAMTGGLTTGGLVINWKMSDPTIINRVKPGPDGNPLHNHDPQVDLLYLVALADYVQLHPDDTLFNSDLNRMMTFVHQNFQQYDLPQGWIYFALLKVGQITHNATMTKDAYTVAHNFYQNWYDSLLGVVYDMTHFPGDYTTNQTLQCGAALIDAGIRWNQPNWITAGENTVDHVLAMASDPTYHLFYTSMTINYSGKDTVENYQVKPSTEGEAVDALLTAYTLTNKAAYLNAAKQILTSMFTTSGLWDASFEGFSFALDLNSKKLETDYKETMSQTLMLLGVHHYDQIKPDFIIQEQQLASVIANHFYQPTYHGFFYRVTPNFQVYVSHTSAGAPVTEDYFTTEAMGSALDALMQYESTAS